MNTIGNTLTCNVYNITINNNVNDKSVTVNVKDTVMLMLQLLLALLYINQKKMFDVQRSQINFSTHTLPPEGAHA